MADAMPAAMAKSGPARPAGRTRRRSRVGSAWRGDEDGAGNPRGRQPLDFGRLAGRGRRSSQARGEDDWPSAARQERGREEIAHQRIASGWPRLFQAAVTSPASAFMPVFGLPTACTAMGRA